MSVLKKAYLVAYNLASAAVWGWILAQGVQALVPDPASRIKDATPFSSRVAEPLWYVQHAALLEIVHSAAGLVPSPVFTTFIQVMSRVVVLDAFTFPGQRFTFKDTSFYLMVMSWSLVEVVRYVFYAAQLLLGSDKVPAPLFFLRYSLFIVLYPTGITGEILQQMATYPHWRRTPGLHFMERLDHVILVLLYLPLGPFMIYSMYMNRVAAFKKRYAPKPAPPEGLVWPVTNPKTGDRSSTEVTKRIWAEAARGHTHMDRGQHEYVRVTKERDWRWGYMGAVHRHVALALESPQDALGMARAGLAEARGLFVFSRDGQLYSLDKAMSKEGPRGKPLFTGVVRGSKPNSAPAKLVVPYKDRRLDGDALKREIDGLAERGTIEPSAAEAIKLVSDNAREWLDMSNSDWVCMLGASSAMGPFDQLVESCATIVAVDLPRPKIWEMLLRKVRASGATLVFPLNRPQEECKTDADLYAAAGCDMLKGTPELGDWLCSLDTQGKPIAMGNYTYLDGALHVQLAMAGEMLMDRLCKERKDTRLAFLCTPTDVHVIPKEARQAANQNANFAPVWQGVLEAVGMLKLNTLLKPVNGIPYVDGIVSRQGPNYIIAKRLQHWRAILAREEGHIVASNVAPSTFTLSVVSNPLFKLGYLGWKKFPPLEVAQPEFSNAVMFALLVHDLRNPKAKSRPDYKLDNPLQLFSLDSVHGGIWRCAYTVDSVSVPSAIFGIMEEYGYGVFVLLATLGAAAAYVVRGQGIVLFP